MRAHTQTHVHTRAQAHITISQGKIKSRSNILEGLNSYRPAYVKYWNIFLLEIFISHSRPLPGYEESHNPLPRTESYPVSTCASVRKKNTKLKSQNYTHIRCTVIILLPLILPLNTFHNLSLTASQTNFWTSVKLPLKCPPELPHDFLSSSLKNSSTYDSDILLELPKMSRDLPLTLWHLNVSWNLLNRLTNASEKVFHTASLNRF